MQKNMVKYIAGLAVALIASIGLGYFIVSYQGEGENYSGSNNDTPKINVENKISTVGDTEAKVDEFKDVEKQTGSLNPLDLSLGALSIDDPEDKVFKVLGQPPSSKIEDSGIRLKYNDFDVVIKNKKISAFVCRVPSMNTPRDIHIGSDVQTVFDKYGNVTFQSDYENLTLYEYEITSKDGNKCYLRFAVDKGNNKVDYISMRYV